MNEKDLLLVSYLRQDARMSLTRLAKKTGMPVSTVFNKVKNKFDNKIIRFTSLVDFAALGYNLKAYLLFRVKKDQKEAFLKTMQNDFNVNNLFKINNGWDVMAECLFKDLNHLESFLENLEEKFVFKAKEIHYVLSDLQRECFLANPMTISLI